MTTITPLHYTEYFSKLEGQEQNSAVLFGSPHCGACRAIKKKLSEETISIPIFEIEASLAIGLVEEFRIHHLPTIILYKKGIFHRFFFPDLRESMEKQIMEVYELPSQEDPSC